MRKCFKYGKKWMSILGCGILCLGLTACGAKSTASDTNSSTSANWSAWESGISYDSATIEEKAEYEYEKAETPKVETDTNQSFEESNRKVIKTARLSLQTLDFDAFSTALEKKITEASAYLQYADISGNSYSGGRKSGSYTIRVPEQNLDSFLTGLEGIATVVSKTLGEEDVTLSYVDTKSRIKTLETEQERLLALLEKAEDLESIILLEQRLSEVRYEIESYQAKLRTYDDKITYSTVSLSVREVVRVTEKEPETVGERIQSGLSNTMYDMVEAAKDFFVFLVVNIPYFVVLGAVLAVVVVVWKKKKRKHFAKKIQKQSEKNETKLDSKE